MLVTMKEMLTEARRERRAVGAFNIANYEGMCLGPRLDDGSSALVLVSAGGNDAKKEIMTMRLTGLDVKSRP